MLLFDARLVPSPPPVALSQPSKCSLYLQSSSMRGSQLRPASECSSSRILFVPPASQRRVVSTAVRLKCLRSGTDGTLAFCAPRSPVSTFVFLDFLVALSSLNLRVDFLWTFRARPLPDRRPCTQQSFLVSAVARSYVLRVARSTIAPQHEDPELRFSANGKRSIRAAFRICINLPDVTD